MKFFMISEPLAAAITAAEGLCCSQSESTIPPRVKEIIIAITTSIVVSSARRERRYVSIQPPFSAESALASAVAPISLKL